MRKGSWKEREPKGKCPYCHDPIWAGGIRREGKLWHRTCWRRNQVEKLRRRTATRGHYAEKR